MLSSSSVRRRAIPSAFLIPALGAAVICISCVPMTPLTEVKTALSNKSQYLSDTFSKSSLPKTILDSADQPGPFDKKFSKFTVVYDAESESNGKKEQFSQQLVFTNLGGGVLREEAEWQKNEIPYSAFYSLSYLGLISLKGQSFNYSSKYLPHPWEYKTIAKFPKGLLAPAKDASYEFAGDWGTTVQTSNWKTLLVSMKTVDVTPAKDLSSALSGDAMLISVEDKGDSGLTTSKSTYYYLMDYGVALKKTFQTSAVKNSWTVKSVKID